MKIPKTRFCECDAVGHISSQRIFQIHNSSLLEELDNAVLIQNAGD